MGRKELNVGEVIVIGNNKYHIRAKVDDMIVFRHKSASSPSWTYKIESPECFEFRLRKPKISEEKLERNQEIYERHLSGETYSHLGRDFSISPSRVNQICAKQARKEKAWKPPNDTL